MIHFDLVSYTYPNAGEPALLDLSLKIDDGEFVPVSGVSGSCINGLVPHFYGGRFGERVLVTAQDTREYEPRDLANIVAFVLSSRSVNGCRHGRR